MGKKNIYEKIQQSGLIIPDSFIPFACQFWEIKRSAQDEYDMMYIAFKFGYMQGVRAERAGKAKI